MLFFQSVWVVPKNRLQLEKYGLMHDSFAEDSMPVQMASQMEEKMYLDFINDSHFPLSSKIAHFHSTCQMVGERHILLFLPRVQVTVNPLHVHSIKNLQISLQSDDLW